MFRYESWEGGGRVGGWGSGFVPCLVPVHRKAPGLFYNKRHVCMLGVAVFGRVAERVVKDGARGEPRQRAEKVIGVVPSFRLWTQGVCSKGFHGGFFKDPLAGPDTPGDPTSPKLEKISFVCGNDVFFANFVCKNHQKCRGEMY